MNLKPESATIEDFESLNVVVNEFYKYLAEEKNEVFDLKKSNLTNRKYLRKFLNKEGCNYVICKNGDIILGYAFVSIESDNPEMAFINEFFVMPGERNKGIGHQLLLECMKWLKDKSCRTAMLSVNTKNKQAISLYRKAGFLPNESCYVDMSAVIK